MKSRNRLFMYAIMLILGIVAMTAYYDGGNDRENVSQSVKNQE